MEAGLNGWFGGCGKGREEVVDKAGAIKTSFVEKLITLRSYPVVHRDNLVIHRLINRIFQAKKIRRLREIIDSNLEEALGNMHLSLGPTTKATSLMIVFGKIEKLFIKV